MSNSNMDSSLAKANGAATDFKTKVQGAEQQVEKYVREAGEKVGAVASKVARSTEETLDMSRDYVKANPLKGILYSIASGVVVGAILTMIFGRSSKK